MSKFDSTSLPQTSEPKEIQKMGLDLLDKLNKTWDQIATAIAALPSQKVYAPLPQLAEGVGQCIWISAASGANLYLPAGGSWAIENMFYLLDSSGAMFGAIGGSGGYPPYAAGGTLLMAGSAGLTAVAKVWRIA